MTDLQNVAHRDGESYTKTVDRLLKLAGEKIDDTATAQVLATMALAYTIADNMGLLQTVAEAIDNHRTDS